MTIRGIIKHLFFGAVLTIFLFSCASSENIFELSPSQSMLITGKGPGQDAANNPYRDTGSIAIIKNLSSNPFQVRLQKESTVSTFQVDPKERLSVTLNPGTELYLDSSYEGKAKLVFREL